jgi:hypothetical protein
MFGFGDPAFAFDWFQAATRAHMLLSQTMPDEMLDDRFGHEPVGEDDELLMVA